MTQSNGTATGDAGGAVVVGTQDVPLVGREHERQAIGDALAAAAAGSGRCLIIEGEAGFGKSRLMREAQLRARQEGFEVLVGHGRELGRNQPFGSLTDVIDAFAGAGDEAETTMRDAQESGGTDLSGAHFRIAERVIEGLEDLASTSLVLLAVEDLQWADVGTLRIVSRASRLCSGLKLAVLGTTRPVTESNLLRAFLDEILRAGADTVRLGPLAPTDVERLAAEVIGGEPGPQLQRQLTSAGGNPLFVLELLDVLAAEGLLSRNPNGIELSRTRRVPSLDLTILRRLSLLPPECLQLLRAAAVLGTSFEVSELVALTHRPTVQLLGQLEAALGSGVIVQQDDLLAFSHELVRRALYDDTPVAIRRSLHREAGEALARSGARATTIAAHFREGARPGDTEAIEWLRHAAKEVAPQDGAASLQLLERALELAGPQHPQRDLLQAELAEHLVATGDPARAEALARALLDGPHDESLRPTLLVTLLRALLLQDRYEGATPLLERLEGRGHVPPDARARFFADAALLLSGSAEFHGDATFLAERALRVARDDDNEVARSLALSALAYIAGFHGRLQDALRHAEDALEAAHRAGEPAFRNAPHYQLAGHLLWADRVEDARHLLEQGRAIAERLGTTWALPVYHQLLGSTAFFTGRWEDARAEWETGLALAHELQTLVQQMPAFTRLIQLALQRDDLPGARRYYEDMVRETGHDPHAPAAHPFGLVAEALLTHAAGDLDRAGAFVERAATLIAERDHRFMYRLAGIDLVRIALAAERKGVAENVARALDLLAGEDGFATTRAFALHARGLVAGDPQPLVEAAATYHQVGRSVEAAFAEEDAGSALAAAGATREAKGLLESAGEAYRSFGARKALARTDATLRAAGVRRRVRGSRPRATSGWAALTQTERRVAALVAEGLNNRQVAERIFISRRTVDAHMAHIFTKLGITSRVQLAALTLQHTDTS